MKYLFVLMTTFGLMAQTNVEVVAQTNWRLNYVQNANQDAVFAEENQNYMLEIAYSSFTGQYQFNMAIYQSSFFFAEFNSESSFLSYPGGCLCTGPPCDQLSSPPVNHCFIDSFYQFFFYENMISPYTFTITELPNNELALDIYNVNNDRINFKSVGLSQSNFDIKSISILPNPTLDFLNINAKFPILKAALYDINGRKLKTYVSNFHQIDIQSFDAGIYFITVEGANDLTFTQKIIKQ